MTQDIEFNRGSINPGECISGGWELIKDNYWLFLGIVVLTWIMTACIPCVNFFLYGPIMAGVTLCFLTQMRQAQPIEFGMMFKGFENIVPTMVIGIIIMIPTIILNILQYAGQFAQLAADINKPGGGSQFFIQNDNQILAGIGILLLLVYVGFLFLWAAWGITFFFAIPIVAEHPELEIIEVLKLSARAGWSNFGMIIILAILQILVLFGGALALCIGVFFVLPIVFASSAVAYRQVFPETTIGNNMFNVPPPPTAYDNQFRG